MKSTACSGSRTAPLPAAAHALKMQPAKLLPYIALGVSATALGLQVHYLVPGALRSEIIQQEMAALRAEVQALRQLQEQRAGHRQGAL